MTRSPFFILLLGAITLLLSSCLMRPQSLTVAGGELHGRLTWQGEVRLRGDVLLADDAELRILPGTRVLFLPPGDGEQRREHPYFPGSELIVRGQLLAEGTATQPIRFAAADPSAAAGSWGGINIEDSVRAVFSYCSFRQADSAIHARRSWVSIDNCLFEQNLVGIRFHEADILIENNLLQDNGAAIRFHLGAPVICNNLIRNNEKGLFITSDPREYRIEKNNFLNNRPYQVTVGEGVREPVELGNNYWGEKTAEELNAVIYDGRVDDWLGRVNYLPRKAQPVDAAGGQWNR